MSNTLAGESLQSADSLITRIRGWAEELGFAQLGVASVDLTHAEPGLLSWLERGFHGEMHYMRTHGLKRARPAELVPGTLSVLTLQMHYLPKRTQTLEGAWIEDEKKRLTRPDEGVISIYARGRDYHKVMRTRLDQLAKRIQAQVNGAVYRVFTDSAPVLEAELAVQSGLGWRGKHTLILNRTGGSMFFLGEIYLNFSLPATAKESAHCGTCTACIDVCPTAAILEPYVLDARKCISYLTIEHPGPIPIELRPKLGNRIYGCDDCQTACPWNKFAKPSVLSDFDVRAALLGREAPDTHSATQLVEYFSWTEQEFNEKTEGSAIRRIGHARWLRNVAVAMGNALREQSGTYMNNGLSAQSALERNRLKIRQALGQRLSHPNPLVVEHVRWALDLGP